MTLVTYLRKSFSIREDDSRAPHFSPTLCQYNRLDRLVWKSLPKKKTRQNSPPKNRRVLGEFLASRRVFFTRPHSMPRGGGGGGRIVCRRTKCSSMFVVGGKKKIVRRCSSLFVDVRRCSSWVALVAGTCSSMFVDVRRRTSTNKTDEHFVRRRTKNVRLHTMPRGGGGGVKCT